MQKAFARRVLSIIEPDLNIIGLAAAGSWISDSLDNFSDLDLILFTKEKISDDGAAMYKYASRFGKLLSAFTGEHVGEPRLLICLFDDPLLHVDIKFLTPGEFVRRVEDPVILFDRTGEVEGIMRSTKAIFPEDSFQWIEDRFWVWIHYLAARLGRGELYECIDGLTFLRARVLGSLLQKKNGVQPRGMRRIERHVPETELSALKGTVPHLDRTEIRNAILQAVNIYRMLRRDLFGSEVQLRPEAEKKAIAYLDQM